MEGWLPGTSGARAQLAVVVGNRNDHELAPILPQHMVAPTAWEPGKSLNHAMRTLVQVRFGFVLPFNRYVSSSVEWL